MYEQQIIRFRDHDSKAISTATVSGVVLGLMTSNRLEMGVLPLPILRVYLAGVILLAVSLLSSILAMILVKVPIPTPPSRIRAQAAEAGYSELLNAIATQYAVGYESYSAALEKKSRFVLLAQICLLVGVFLAVVSVVVSRLSMW